MRDCYDDAARRILHRLYRRMKNDVSMGNFARMLHKVNLYNRLNQIAYSNQPILSPGELLDDMLRDLAFDAKM